MRKLIIFTFAIFFVALKVFGLSDPKTENPNITDKEFSDLIVFALFLGLIIASLLMRAKGKKNLTRIKKWSFEDLSFRKHPRKKNNFKPKLSINNSQPWDGDNI